MKTPGIVIFVAILNFISAMMFMGLAAFSGIAILFGAAWGIDSYITKQIAQYATNHNFSYGLTLIFGALLFVFVVMSIFFFSIGIGLLRGKKFAWFLQLTMSILGLIGLPLGLASGVLALPLSAIFNIVILIFFFRPRVREYFRA